MQIVATPSTAAGAPPRNTIASTSARKLPEILTLEADTAQTSLAVDRASSAAKSSQFQSALPAVATATSAANPSTNSSATTRLFVRIPCNGTPPATEQELRI